MRESAESNLIIYFIISLYFIQIRGMKQFYFSLNQPAAKINQISDLLAYFLWSKNRKAIHSFLLFECPSYI